MKNTIRYALYAFILLGSMSSCKKFDDFSFKDTSDNSPNAAANPILISFIEKPKGLYAVSRVDKAQEDIILKNTSIDGIFLRTKWSSIESVEGVYNWTFIDSEIDRAILNNKKIEIAIIAGEFTPSWLERKGVPFLDFKVIPHGGEGNPHWTHIPVVWDTQFITSYTNLVKAFGRHLKSSNARYDAVSLIKINGINQETAETRLPYQDSTYISGTDTASNCAKIWIANGYTMDKVVTAWQQIAAIYVRTFPDKALGLAIIPDPRGFPSIDANGNQIANKLNVTTQTIVDKSINFSNNQNVLLFNALTDKVVTFDLLTYVTQHNATLSFQEKEVYYPKSDIWVEDMIKNGVNSGAEFIEVFNETIKSYPTGVVRGRICFP